MLTTIHVYDETGHNMLPHHPAHGKVVSFLGEWHVAPGLGLGRECPGFLNRLGAKVDPASSGHQTIVGQFKAAVRLLLKTDGQPDTRLWLVHELSTRGDCDRLRNRMWPTTRRPHGHP